ncbi:MFS transporter, partial [Cellulomonas sp. KRMCY2]|uniref:MFS transporter n=1 Tax=Cellulomonas sp. KRMCY2 TaxID=1304865 RepID=UPI0004A3725B
MTEVRPAGLPAGRSTRHANPALVLGFLSLAGLVISILQSLVAPALPVIAADLSVTTADVSWILTAYLLAASVSTPVAARLGDMFGKRRVLLVVLSMLAAGTLVAALAPNLSVLIAGRVLQGAAGAILPLSIGIVRDELPIGRVGMAVGTLSAIFGVGGGLGIVLAGPIVDNLSWHWLFWFPLALIGIAFAGVAFGVPESPVRAPGRVDWTGALLLSAGLAMLLLALSKGSAWGWSSGRVVGMLIAAGFTLGAWVIIERRIQEPLVDMRMMATRAVWATNVVGLAFGFAMFGAFLLVPMLLELPKATGFGFGASVTTAGLYLLPATAGMLVFAPISGALERRVGARVPMVLGTAIAAGAFAFLAISHTQAWQLLVSVSLVGIGIGLAFAAMANAIVAAVPPTQTGVATSVNTIVRTVGGSLGAAILAGLLTAGVSDRGIPTDAAFTQGFWLSAAVLVVGLLASLLLPRRTTQQADA